MRKVFVLSLLLAVALVAPAPVLAQGDSGDRASARAAQLFVAGMTKAYAGDHAGAITLYEHALGLRPGEAAVLAALAESHRARGDLGAALFHAEQAAKAAPTEPELHRLLAGLRHTAGDPAGAVEALRQVVALTPSDPAAHLELARAQQQAGQHEAALGTYEELLDVVGESADIRTRMLQIYRRLGDVEGAIGMVDMLLKLHPDHAPLYQQLAELYLALERDDEAAAALEALLELEPGNHEVRRLLANLYRGRGDETSATTLLEEGAALGETSEPSLSRAAELHARSLERPHYAEDARRMLEDLAATEDADPAALFMLGELRLRAGDFAGAIESLTVALEAEPGHPPAWEQLAVAHLEAGDAASAIEIAEEALLLFPGQYPLLRIAAHALMQEGRDAEAAGHASTAVALLADDYPEAIEERVQMLALAALAHMRMGDTPDSDALHEEALELDPDHAMSLNNFAYDLAERGQRLDEALTMAQRAVGLDPENTSFLDTLGWVHHVRGDHQEAIRWLSRAAELAEARGRPRAVYFEHLGEAQVAAGDAAGAVQSWERALELEPERTHLRQRIEQAR